jgi:hypothetical protein
MKKIIPLVSIFALLLIPTFAGAQVLTEQTFVAGVSNISGALGVINKIATWFLTIVVAIAVIMFVYAGFLYLTSGGDDEKIKSAKNYLLYGIIGIAVALLAGALVRLAVYFASQSGNQF